MASKAGAEFDLKEIVMGLHWDPPQKGASADPGNLDALPAAVSTIAFVVASATGRAFSGIRGASCHISDRVTEREWVRLELTTLGRHTAHCVATLHRGPTGWKMSSDAQNVRGGFLSEPELLSLAASVRGSSFLP